MKDLLQNKGKVVSVTLRTVFSISMALMLSLIIPSSSYAQCSCTSTVNNNTSFVVGPGQVVCLNKNNYSGTITLNGGTLCINSGITVNPSWVYTAASTINNSGTIGTALTIGNGYSLTNNSGATISNTLTVNTGGTVSNTGTLSGNLVENGGAFTNNSGGVVSGTSSINGTFSNAGNITNNITINSGGSLSNSYATLTATISGMASGATFTNTGTYSGSISSSAGSTVTNSGTMTLSGGSIAGTFTSTSGSTTTNNITMSGATNIGGSFTNNTNGNLSGTTTITGSLNNGGNMSGTVVISASGTMTNNSNNVSGSTNITVNGTLTNDAYNLNGTITVNSGATLTNSSGGLLQSGTLTGNAGSTIINNGTIADNTTISGTITNNHTISGTLTGTAGSTITNNSSITGGSNNIAGTLINNSGASISNGVTESAGGSITNSGTMGNGVTVNGGTFNNTSSGNVTGGSGLVITGGTVTNSGSTLAVNISGGTLNNSSTISNLTISGGTLNNTGTINGSVNISGGAITNASGATIAPSNFNTSAGSGSLTNNGTLTLPSGTTNIYSGYTVTNNGTMTSGPITVNAGGTLTLNGIETINGNVSNNGTINLGGSLALGGYVYSGNGTMNETNPGCNSFTVNTNNSTGTFNGGQSSYGGGLIVNSTSGGATLTNGASAVIAPPTQQPTGLSIPLTGLTVNGSFTSPSATITGYIVLRYIGTSAPSDNPTNYTAYTVGSTIGSSTVVALVTGGSTGVKTFTDNIPSGDCGQNIYYRIFSYDGAGTCRTFDLSGPLTGSVAIPSLVVGITPSGATTFCAPGSVNLTATGGGTYSWSTSATSATITASASGTYIVTVTSASGCTATASQVVTVNPAPSAAISPVGPSTFCGSGTLTASGGTSYVWNATGGSATTSSITATASGTYTVTVTGTGGCTATASNSVTVNPLPVVAAISGTTHECAGSTTTLSDATAGGVWSSSNTGAATISGGLVTGVSAGTSTISYAVTSSGCTTTVTKIDTVIALPVIAAITGTTSVCVGSTTTLSNTTTGGVWSKSNATANITAGGIVTGVSGGLDTIYYTVTNANGCVNTVSTVVTINTVPAAVTVSGGTTQCGGTVTLTANGGTGGTIYWENTTSNGTSTATASSSQTVSATGTYYFRADNVCGWSTQGSAAVTINPYPVVAAITGTTSVCPGSTTTLSDVTTGGVWSSSNTSVATVSGGIVTGVAAGTATISYTVTSSGCPTTVTTTVTVNSLPTPTVNNATSCSGATVTLTATGGTSYMWSTGATVDSITTTTAGTYTVTVTSASGCSATAHGTVTAVTNPAPTANNPAVCAGSTAVVECVGGGGGTYLWSTGSTTDTINTMTAGVYTVTVTRSGCIGVATAIVTVNALPTPSVPNDTACAGSIATLTVTGGVAYTWSTGAHTASITTTTAGTYTVTATSMGSCTASASGSVTLVSSPTASASNGVICSGAPTTLTASGGVSYVWSTGATSASITVSTAGTYHVTVSNANGCTASAAASATSAAVPTPTANNSSICIGTSATLTATGGVSYVWSTGATTAGISVSPVATTIYSVTATNAATCTASISDTVTVNPLPAATVTSGSICTATPATLTASGGNAYHWSTGATTASITTALIGTYTVTVSNTATGCSATASGTVTLAVASIVTVNSAAACSGTSVTLNATLTAGGPCTYLWSNGANTPSISIAPGATTTYTVTATNTAGCQSTASGTATVYALPSASANSNSPVLLNGTINLTSTVSGGTSPYTYAWSGPSSFTSAVANPSQTLAQPTNGGIYTVTVSDNHSCTASASTTVILNFTSPGGIPSNDALWLNASTGVSTSGSNVTTWADQSGLANNANVVNGTAPTLVTNSLNYHPVVSFGGLGGLKGAFSTAITSNSASAFIVTNTAASNAQYTGLFSIANSTGNNTDYSTNNTACVFLTGGSNEMATDRNGVILGNYTNANALGNYHMFSSLFSSTSNENYFYTEGANSTNATNTSANFGSSIYSIGSRWVSGSPTYYLNGQIAEVILFNTQITAAQRNQVESYLATKYGFTLNQTTATNYVASNGSIFWNATTNGSYKNNIFGVGIDNISTLNQTASVSINTNKLSINSATGLTYYSFLMVADNGGANTLSSQTNLPNKINADISTIWRVSQTGSRATANYVFNTSSTSFGYYAPISSSMSVYMLIDSNADGVYETYLAPTSTVGTNYTFNANLKDGTLFTFGFKASIDYGDAPGVPTLIANNGAGHMIVPGVYLGSLIDAEIDGQPSVNSVGDDTIGLADEDGVNFNIGVPTSVNIVTMGTNTITVTASVPGYLNAWADFNQDNTYGGGSEYAIQNIHLLAGVNTVTFTVSDSVLYGPTSMRFRFDTINGDVTTPTGLAKNGEVEDYKIYVTAPLVGACTNGFQNPSFEQGPDPSTYLITNESNMPYWRTTAADNDIEQWQSGFNGVPAYNGNYFMELEANLYGALYQDVYTTPGTKLTWSFAHRGRMGSDTAELKIGPPGATVYQATAIDGNTAWGLHSGFYTVPAGQYITRLEFWAVGSYGGNTSIGNFLDDVAVESSFDYGDAPDSYGTLFASNGPYHNITSNLYLGYGVTCDSDGRPGIGANRDSLDDGVTFPAACPSCNTYSVTINAYNNSGSPATIAGWMDFNKNGVFDASERTSVTIPSSTSEQTVTLTFTVNAFSANSSSTYARFRIANDSTQIATPYGLATSGEVEDYLVPCVALPTAIPTASPNPACARGILNLTATGTAPAYSWKGPNGFTSTLQNPTITNVPAADSGTFTVYAIYANGCATDSSVKVVINSSCISAISGHIFDDANGNGIIDGTDATTDLGRTIYAVLSDNTNTVLATSLISATGSFSFPTAPAYMTGMTIVASTTNPTVGTTSGGPLWPSRWTGTKGNYGTGNLAGTGIDNTPNLIPVSTGVNNVSNILLGFDQLPSTDSQTYIIPYPDMNATKSLTPSNGLGVLAGLDPEDGSFGIGSTFTITSLAGMNGNSLYYDANGDGTLQSYEQITGYTTITNFDPTKLIIKFTGAGSIQASFNYATTDAASKVDPTPATYVIKWVGTLPVTMLYFTANKLGESESELKWATASEIDNDHFDIERSADAESWEKIGEQKGAGTSSMQNNYSMIDQSPLSGVNYYRLKQVDVDGNFSYSDIAQVTFGEIQSQTQNQSALSVYPNPLSQASKLNIDLTGTDNISEISITNSIGQVVYTTNLPQIQNYQIVGLNLPSGVYIVSVRTQADTMISSRLVITK